MTLNRRSFNRLLLGSACFGSSTAVTSVLAQEDALLRKAIEVEESLGARLGLAIIDEATGRSWQYQADQRFPMCSTFKVLAAAAFLARVDRGEDQLKRRVILSEDDLVSYSPGTENRLGGQGMTMAEICEAALTLSDNTAGNVILRSIGGPAGLTQFARGIGDDVTRLDRWETELNEARPGDPRDTTSPGAMAGNLRELLLGGALSADSKRQLGFWMRGNRTGDAKLRAGLPPSWVVGDKTGGGQNGTMADVAIIWPGRQETLIAAVYMTQTSASFDDRNAGIAEIAQALTLAI